LGGTYGKGHALKSIPGKIGMKNRKNKRGPQERLGEYKLNEMPTIAPKGVHEGGFQQSGKSRVNWQSRKI